MTKLKMLYDRILVRVLDENTKTTGGLYIPSIAKDNSPWRSAEVVSVGVGRLMRDGTVTKLLVKVGDCIWFYRAIGRGDQVAVEIDGVDYLVIPEDHVMAVVDGSSLQRGTGLLGASGAEIVVGAS